MQTTVWWATNIYIYIYHTHCTQHADNKPITIKPMSTNICNKPMLLLGSSLGWINRATSNRSGWDPLGNIGLPGVQAGNLFITRTRCCFVLEWGLRASLHRVFLRLIIAQELCDLPPFFSGLSYCVFLHSGDWRTGSLKLFGGRCCRYSQDGSGCWDARGSMCSQSYLPFVCDLVLWGPNDWLFTGIKDRHRWLTL